MISQHSLLLQRSSKLLNPKASTFRARKFHSSQPHHNALIDLSHQIFENVHTVTGLPWALSIPLTAALFRLAFVPIQYFGLRRSRERQFLRPFKMAQAKVLRRQLDRLRIDGAFRSAIEDVQWYADESKRREAKLQENYKTPSHWLSTLLPIGFLPIWFVNAGVIQAMAGVGGRGLLAMVFDSTVLPPPEPGFETEGFLWIPQLNEMDPAFILPTTFGLLLWLSVRASAPQQDISRTLEVTRMIYPTLSPQRILTTAGVQVLQIVRTLPLLMPLILSHTPAAFCLFAIGSAATQVVLSSLVKAAAGVKAPIMPLIPQVPILKHKYRDRLSMDIWRPPSKHGPQSAVSLDPQAQLQDSKGSQPARAVAKPSGSQSSDSGHCIRR